MKKYLKTLLPILIVWIIIYAWRPWFLGYYADDWNYIFVPQEKENIENNIDHYMIKFINRPVMGIVHYATTEIFRESAPVYRHIYLIILMLVNAIFIRLFFDSIFKYLKFNNARVWSNIGAVFWLASPCFIIWFSSANNIFAMLFFLLSGIVFFNGLNRGKIPIILPPILFIISCLAYESFYLQFFVLFLFGYAGGLHKKFGWKKIVISLVIFFLAQAIAIGWNRVSAIVFENACINKPFNPYFIQTFLANIFFLPYALFKSCSEIWYLVTPFFGATLGLTIYYIFKNKFNILKNDKIIFWIFVSVIAAILITLFIYSGAGYIIWGMGMRSRTTMTISLWLAFAFSFVFFFLVEKTTLSNALTNFLIIACIITLGIASYFRIMDWHHSWETQKKVISEVPFDKIYQTDENAMILVDAPYHHNWVSIIKTPWDVNMQLKAGGLFVDNVDINDVRKNIGKRKFQIVRNYKDPISGNKWVNIWTGSKLIQKYRNVKDDPVRNKFLPKRVFHPSELWIWKYETNEFYQVTEPQTMIFKNYDVYFKCLTDFYYSFKEKI